MTASVSAPSTGTGRGNRRAPDAATAIAVNAPYPSVGEIAGRLRGYVGELTASLRRSVQTMARPGIRCWSVVTAASPMLKAGMMGNASIPGRK